MIAEGQVRSSGKAAPETDRRLDKAMIHLDRSGLDRTFMVAVRREGARKAVA